MNMNILMALEFNAKLFSKQGSPILLYYHALCPNLTIVTLALDTTSYFSFDPQYFF